jgi:putative ABC transport system ATP-binding protein/lipoprotein-releasing system ATP-binding protein
LSQIELKDIGRSYTLENVEIKAVEGVSLKIRKGEFLSIVGHSGSGKTTLLSIIGGILSPTEGRMIFEGADIYELGEDALSEYRAEKIGFTFQFASLLPVLTSKENVMLPAIFKPPGRGDGLEENALEYLDMVGLAEKANAYPSQLSGGQQRRVAIARAMMNDPEVILADEPTGDLDEDTEAEVMRLFLRINKEKRITFILVTHSSEIARQADTRLIMDRGRITRI